MQETLKAKERVINCLREAKVQTDENLRKTVEISTSDMEELKNKLQQAEQTACDLEKQKKLYENERNTQKVRLLNYRTIDFQYLFLDIVNSDFHCKSIISICYL